MIKAGTVWINGHNMFDAAAGFGKAASDFLYYKSSCATAEPLNMFGSYLVP